MSKRRTFLVNLAIAAGIMGISAAGACADPAGRRDHQRVVRPHARALSRAERRLRQAVAGQHRPEGHHPHLARRLGQAGALGDRRPGGRRRHPGAGRRHRRHRARVQAPAGELAVAPAQQRLALHLDHRVRGAQGQPQGHQGLARPRPGRRLGHDAQSQDLGRRALELSRRLGLRARPRPARRPGGGAQVRRGDLQERAGARFRRARLDHHLRPARRRRRAGRLGERGLPDPAGIRRRQVRDRRSRLLDPGRAAGLAGRLGGRQARHPQGGRGLSRLPLFAGRPRRSSPRTSTGRASPTPPIRPISPASRRSGWSPSTRRSAAGPRRRPSISPRAARSTRSTSPAASRRRDERRRRPRLGAVAGPAERAAGLRHHAWLCR